MYEAIGPQKKMSASSPFSFSPGAFYHIRFHHQDIRMLCHKGFKVSVSTVLPVTRHGLFFVMPAPWLGTDFTVEVQVDGKILVDVIV